MKKTVAIGDIHGDPIWKNIVEKESPDEVVFVGDYFDSFDIPVSQQIDNFNDIINYKNSSSYNVELLIGNHDASYISGYNGTKTAGFQNGVSYTRIKITIEPNKHLLKMAHRIGDILFTHAGVSSVFMDEVWGIDGWHIDDIESLLNEKWIAQPRAFEFIPGRNPYGNNTNQSPIWIRPRSLMAANKDNIRKKLIQVVGHTGTDNIDIKGKSTGGRYYFIDTLRTSGEYLIIQGKKLSVGSI